jgi:hypothetical protein
MPVSLDPGQSATDCGSLCWSHSHCMAWSFSSAGCSGTDVSLCSLKARVTEQSYNPCTVSGVKNSGLLTSVFRSLPLGAVQPTGWLREQLALQASGLSGHLPFFWPDVMNSSWMGGRGDTGLHERTPYWLNGFIPLAYQLQDPSLIHTAQEYINYILAHQAADGWLGPTDRADGNCYWSKFPLLLALRQYYEANTSDTRVIPAMLRFLNATHKLLFTIPLGDTWSAARWQDLVLTVHWLLEFHPSGQEQLLWDLAELLHQQGFDWEEWFGGPDFPTGPVVSLSMFTHGVNNGQAIKSGAVWYRQSGNHSDWESSYVRMQKLDEYHGQASGVFGCDEHLAGRMPSRGTELCTVVESMFSYETLFEIQGDPIFAERAEKIGYNALPATITPDMWAHQYLQQANEMNAVTSDQHIWFSDGPNSTLFGLAPNYGCCTANFNQGWPKLVQHLVYAYSNGSGLVVAMYGPAHIQHTLPSGQPVTLDITTDYPFSQTVVVDVSTTGSLDISLRIPSWAKGASVQVNSDSPVPATPGTLHQVSVAGRTTVILKLPASLRVERRYNNSAAIHYGPLLFGLAMKENFKVLESYKFQSKDYQITTGTPWNYALRLSNDSQPEQDLKVFSSGLEIGVPPFSLRGAPIAISAAVSTSFITAVLRLAFSLGKTA